MTRSRALIPIFLVVLVDVFGLTLILPLLAIYAESLHASPLQATLLVSVFAACQLVSGPVLGRWSDRIGRKPVLLLSQLGTLVGFLVMARASSLWLLYVARVIDGATAGNVTVAQAYIADNPRPEERGRSFALIGMAFGLGFLCGPFVTGSLVRYGLAAPIHLASALSLLSIVCTLVLLPGGRPGPGADRDGAALPTGRRLPVLEWAAYLQYLRRPVLGGLLAQFFCYSLGMGLFTSGFALFAERRLRWDGHPFTPREIGFLFGYAGLLGLVWQGGLLGRLIKRYGEARLATAGFLSIVIGSVALGLTYSVAALIAFTTVASFGNSVLRPVLSSLVSMRADKHEQGVVLGLVQSLSSLAAIVAPPLGGVLLDHGQLAMWAWLGALAALAGLGLARWGSAHGRPAA
jgi:MFS family permease